MTQSRIDDMAFAFWQSGTLIAAIELGLFTAISEGFNKPTEIAERIKVPLDSIDRLMSACTGLKLIERKDEKYINTPDVEMFLVAGKPSYRGDYYAIQAKNDYEGWNNIAPALRQPVSVNKKQKKGYGKNAEDPQFARDYTVAGFKGAWAGAQEFAAKNDFSQYSLFLDLGGGSGAYSIAAVQKHPHLKAIVFDYPDVVVVAQEYINKAGVSDRVKTVAGDFFDTEFPRGADLAAYIAPLQVYGPDDVRFLVNKAFNTIEPGGGLIIIDYMINADKSGPAESLFRHLQQRTNPNESPGYINTETEFREYLMTAGFTDIVVIDLRDGPMGFVFGKKPK